MGIRESVQPCYNDRQMHLRNLVWEIPMLDAYIIQKIKEEAEADSSRIPLHIEIPMWPPQQRERESDEEDIEKDDHGVVIIDYSV